MKIYTKMYIKMFSNYLFGLCNFTEECCYCGKYLYAVIQCHLMGCVCGSCEFVCVLVPLSSMHANAGDFLCLHTSIDECI